MAGKKRVGKPMDYSFLKLGGLYDTIVEAMIEACRRFGAEKAHSVISEFSYWRHQGETFDSIRTAIFDETGLRISADDVHFLTAMDDARAMIVQTEKHLREAFNG